MSEEQNGPDSGFTPPNIIERTIRRTRRLLEITDLKLDKDAVSVRNFLEDIGPSLGFLTNPNNLPKILQIKSPTRELISFRRTEGSELESRFVRVIEPENKNPFDTVFVAAVSPDDLPEGQVLVLDTPDPTLKCTKVETEQYITDTIGARIDDFGGLTWPAMMFCHPELYKPEDWEPGVMDVSLLTKKGGKIFYARIGKNFTNIQEYGISEFGKLKLNRDGKVESPIASCFQSPVELDVYAGLLRKWGRMYSLTEGSGDKSEQKKPVVSFKLVSDTLGNT